MSYSGCKSSEGIEMWCDVRIDILQPCGLESPVLYSILYPREGLDTRLRLKRFVFILYVCVSSYYFLSGWDAPHPSQGST